MASNPFFDWVISAARFAKGTKVRAEAVNAALDSATAGFDLLPTDTQLNRGTRNYIASDTGAADAYAGSLSHVSTAYGDGQEVDILIANTNLTATPTLDVSGIGATAIKAPGASGVTIGVLVKDSIARLKYNATGGHWELTGVYDITTTISAFMATLLDDTTAAAALATLGITATAAEINTLVGNTLKTKVIDIGDWDMDATSSENVSHGLTQGKIRSVSCVIRNDAGNIVNQINHRNIASAPTGDAYINSIGQTSINIVRTLGGYFDSTDYDSTSYNRGWITIYYVD